MRKLISVIGVLAVLGLSFAHAQEQHQDHANHDQMQHDQMQQENVQIKASEQIRYVCPMHSHISQDEPGTCPICGMQLEPQQAQVESVVNVSANMQQNLGIKTIAAEVTTLWRYYPTFGTVQWNENERWHIHSRASGWVEELFVRSEGQRVDVGQKLYAIYSQELVVAQQDFLQTLEGSSSLNSDQRQRLIRDGRLRLELLGFAPSLIKQLEQSREIMYRVPVFADVAGVVTNLGITEGMYIQPSDTLLTINGENSVWLIADVPERYADWLRPQAPVDVTLTSAGLRQYETTIDYIYPELDPVSRTQRVRVRLPFQVNAAELHVGMQAKVELYGGPKRDVLAIPVEALIMTGSENRVIVQLNDGSFVQRPVHVGQIVNQQAEILHGLDEGERVVTSGQFLLDSEASLNSSRMAGEQTSGGGHAH